MSTDEQQPEELTAEEFGLARRGQLIESPRSDAAILVSQAIQQDLDIAKVTELINFMREQTEIDRKQRAQEAYLKAKAKFLGSCPLINADTPADKFNYPSYGRILEVALPLMAKVGLSHTTTPDFEAEIVTCTMKHTLGHEESSTFPMTIEGMLDTGNFKLTLQQKWAWVLTYAERQSFKAVSGVPTSGSDVDMLPQGEPPASGAKEQADPLARTATKIEFDNLTAGWWKFAQPPDGDPGREEFENLDKAERRELFMAWVTRSITGVTLDFVHFKEPHTTFTLRQITDLWAIIHNKEAKVDVNFEPEERRSDSN